MDYPTDITPGKDGVGRQHIAACLALGLAVGSAAAPGHAIEFDDVTDSAGIAQAHHARYFITGQAWGDYDGDGLVDLYLTDSAGPNTLFRNIGNGRFEVSPLNADVALPAHVSGCV